MIVDRVKPLAQYNGCGKHIPISAVSAVFYPFERPHAVHLWSNLSPDNP
jgi:hypothetical protein